MNRFVVLTCILSLSLLNILPSCRMAIYSIAYRGYKVSPLPGSSSDVLRIEIDTVIGPDSQVRLYVTNNSDAPIILHKKFTNLTRMDTVVSVAPFTDDPFSEYSYARSSTSTYSDASGRSGINPYATSSNQLATSSSSSLGVGISSSAMITHKPISESILYPRQVQTFVLNDLVSTAVRMQVKFRYKRSGGTSSTESISLKSYSPDEAFINQGISSLKQNFVELGKQKYTLFFTYSDLTGTSYRTATYSFNFSDLDLKSFVGFVD